MPKDCLFRTKNAVRMSTGIRIRLRMRSSVSRDNLAPTEEPISAATTVGTARRKLISLFLMNLPVENVVPMAEDSLLVAIAACVGRPARR